jgi:predicted transcriptional regulator
MEQKNAQDAIIRAINHPERRQILQILAKSETRYSAILGETGLTTSKLNYQLNELQGLIEKNSEGDYVLTELGQRAVNILQNINENLKGDIELAPIMHNARHNYVTKQLNTIFYIIMVSIVIGAILLTYFSFQPGNTIDTTMLLVCYGAMGLTMFGLNQARKNSPKYLHSLVDWLDWKLFGNGDSRFTGRKMFIMTTMGFLVGLLISKAGLGLIIGLILGAAMEYTG